MASRYTWQPMCSVIQLEGTHRDQGYVITSEQSVGAS